MTCRSPRVVPLAALATLTGLSCAPIAAQSTNFALRLGPRTELRFPHHPAMNTGATATIEFWCRAIGERGPFSWVRYADSAEHKALGIDPNGSIDYLYAGSPWRQSGYQVPGTTITPDGAWHHVAFVRRINGSWSVYADGVQVVNGGPGTGLGNDCWLTCSPINAVTTTVLGSPSPNKEAWDIDELRVSDSERYHSGFVPPRRFDNDNRTMMLLHFDEGSGVSIQDSSAFQQLGGFVGLSGAPSWTWVSGNSSGTPSFTSFAPGCNSATGTPTLSPHNGTLPRLGTTFEMRFSNLPNGYVFVPLGFLGFSNTHSLGVPLPVSLSLYGGPPQCLQHIDLTDAYYYPLANLGGSTEWHVPLPNTPFLDGASVFVQGIVFDWSLPYSLPVLSSNGGEMLMHF